MGPHLIALEIGPVVEFIAAARKTRDLWFGSWLMSEIAKAIARRLAETIGLEHLIFPAPKDLGQLAQGLDYTVADEIWASLPAGHIPRNIADSARQAAHKEWLHHANAIRDSKLWSFLRHSQWELQNPKELSSGTAGEIVECYAAWAEWSGEEADYMSARSQVKRLLMGRTACRNFPQSNYHDAGLPKSSLDGSRPTVLKERPRQGAERLLRITTGEQLDAADVVKRHGGGVRQYPSVSRIAADPWLRGAAKAAPAPFGRFVDTCKGIRDLIVGLPNDRFPQYAPFPYDGTVVYPNRHREIADEAAETPETDATGRRREVDTLLSTTLKPLRDAWSKLAHAHVKEPNPYYAVMVADGDGVGAAIGRLDTIEKHRTFSQTLESYAVNARAIIREFNGVAIFVGGDDILAFLPVDKAMNCARKLRDEIREVLKFYSVADKPISLSAGLAIAHCQDALEEVLARATNAEHTAKSFAGKDAVSIHYQARGGAPIEWTGSWSTNPDVEMSYWAKHLRSGNLPDKVPYDLSLLARSYSDWPKELAALALPRDIERLLSRKEIKGAAKPDILQRLSSTSAEQLLQRANFIIVARRIANALDQAQEDPS